MKILEDLIPEIEDLKSKVAQLEFELNKISDSTGCEHKYIFDYKSIAPDTAGTERHYYHCEKCCHNKIVIVRK